MENDLKASKSQPEVEIQESRLVSEGGSVEVVGWGGMSRALQTLT